MFANFGNCFPKKRELSFGFERRAPYIYIYGKVPQRWPLRARVQQPGGVGEASPQKAVRKAGRVCRDSAQRSTSLFGSFGGLSSVVPGAIFAAITILGINLSAFSRSTESSC